MNRQELPYHQTAEIYPPRRQLYHTINRLLTTHQSPRTNTLLQKHNPPITQAHHINTREHQERMKEQRHRLPKGKHQGSIQPLNEHPAKKLPPRANQYLTMRGHQILTTSNQQYRLMCGTSGDAATPAQSQTRHLCNPGSSTHPYYQHHQVTPSVSPQCLFLRNPVRSCAITPIESESHTVTRFFCPTFKEIVIFSASFSAIVTHTVTTHQVLDGSLWNLLTYDFAPDSHQELQGGTVNPDVQEPHVSL